MSAVQIGDALRDRHAQWQFQLIWKGKAPSELGSGISDADRVKSQTQYDEVVERQKDLLGAVRAGPAAAAAYLLDALAGDGAPDPDALPSLNLVRTNGEMKQPPVEVEAAWYRDLGTATLGRALAAEPAFWAVAHAKWMGDGVFGSDVFGVFCEGGAETNENQVRNFLRRTSGLPEARGSVSVLHDCLVSRGWWRRQLAVEIHRTLRTEAERQSRYSGATHEVPELSADEVHKVLWPSAVWEPLVSESVRRVASANAPKARAALVAALVLRGLPDDGRVTGAETRAAIASLGRLAHGYSLHSASWDLLVNAAIHGLDNPPPKRSADDAAGEAAGNEGSQADDAEPSRVWSVSKPAEGS